MKKFFKMLFMLLMATMTVVSFSSCSDDDDDENGSNMSIVGTWELTESGNDYYYQNIVTFTNKGKWTVETTDIEDGYKYTGFAGGTYVLDGNQLTLTCEYDEEGNCYYVDRLTVSMPNNNTLILTWKEDDYEESETYKRKK